MTVAAQTPVAIHSGDGVTTSFAYSFRLDTTDELFVYDTGSASFPNPLTISTDYSAPSVPNTSGGNVVFGTAPSSGTDNILIVRKTAFTQTTDFSASESWPASNANSAVDRLEMQVQDINEKLRRAPLLSIQENLVDQEFPALVGNKLVAINASGDGFTLTDVPSISTEEINNAVAAAEAEHASKNRIINGRFRIAQKTLPIADPAGVYTLDRWIADIGGGISGSLSRNSFLPGQTNVPGEPEYYATFSKNGTSGDAPYFSQRIEGVRTFAGQQCTFSIYMMAFVGSGIVVTPKFIQDFGDSGSADITTSASTWTLTSNWAKYEATVTLPSISGKTVNANNFLEVKIEFANTPAFDVYMAEAQLEPGSVATVIEPRAIPDEENLCWYYYQRFNPEGATSNYHIPSSGGAYSTTGAWVTIFPKRPLRVKPSVAVNDIADFRFFTLNNQSDNALTSFTLSLNASKESVVIDLTASSTWTDDVAGMVRLDQADSWLELDAEL